MTKNDKPPGVMNGGDSGTSGQLCRRLRGETDARRRVTIIDQAARLIGFRTWEFAPVAASDWHDRCLTHRDFCENRLVDVKVRPHELVGREPHHLPKQRFPPTTPPKPPWDPQHVLPPADNLRA